jgi:hypothetical protein
MIFKFPQKKIVLDCFTDSEITIKAAPIDFAVKHMPDWWKELPATHTTEWSPAGTMKGCMGLIDFYKYSVAIPLWSDLSISIQNKQYQWLFADTATNAQVHRLEVEATGFMPKNYGHLKIISPWVFSCKEDVKWLWNTPLYNLNENPDIVILPGILNYRHQSATNINMLFDISKDRKVLIKLGTPLALITPMSDRRVEIVRHLISREEYLNKVKNNLSFTRKYEKVKELTEKFSSCPFHNHTGNTNEK